MKNKVIDILEDLIFFVVCVLVSVRCQLNESLPLGWEMSTGLNSVDIGSAEITMMVFLAGLILTLFAVWFAVRCWSGRLQWRRSGMVMPLLIMTAAGVVSSVAASNRFLALVGIVNLLSLFVLAVLLVQLLLNSRRRLFLLIIIIATGVTMSYRCLEQHYYDIPQTISTIEDNIDASLRHRGIEPGSFQARQYLDRMYSRDVGGYYSVSNTAASFFILSIMATLGVTAYSMKSAVKEKRGLIIVTGLFFIGFQLLGFFITQSRGGFYGYIFGMLLLAVLIVGRAVLGRYRRTALITAVVLVILGLGAIIFYGISQGRLPGNSLWVRWQYWQATAGMIADHGLTGVGPENYGLYYPRYMNPAAPEVVKDPHSIPLAVFSQWGVFGLIGFLWLIGAVLIRLTGPGPQEGVREMEIAQKGPAKEPVGGGFKSLMGAGIIAVIIIQSIRWGVSDFGNIDQAEKASVFIISFLMPAIVWMGGYLLAAYGVARVEYENSLGRFLMMVVLASSLAGFLLHNCIDYAFFQPGVGTLSFALLALVIALKEVRQNVKIDKNGRLKLLAVALAVGAFAFWLAVYVPVARSQQTYKQAIRLDPRLNWSRIEQLINQADSLTADPKPAFYMSQLLVMRHYPCDSRADFSGLEQSLVWLDRALAQERAHYKYYQHHARIFQSMADYKNDDPDLLDRSLAAWQESLERYPSNSTALFKSAQLLERRGQEKQALAHYRQILTHEEAFLQQHSQMFPDYPRKRQRTPDVILQASREAVERLVE